MTPTQDDILREFSRLNFRHVNDTSPAYGKITEQYCAAVVATVEALKVATEALKEIDHGMWVNHAMEALDKIKRITSGDQ